MNSGKTVLSRGAALLLLFQAGIVAAEEAAPDRRWDIGAGFGYIRYDHYPASNQDSDLFLPFPTFQYRGKVLRAGDRDGAKLYLVKRSNWDLELSGTGYPALNSSKNEARRGMDDLPWMAALGPQAVTRLGDSMALKFGVFQAISTDIRVTRLQGAIWEAKLNYQWSAALGSADFLGLEETRGTLALNLKGASQEIHSLYFGVPTSQATVDRPSYDSRAGFLSHQVGYIQSLRRGRFEFYIGVLRADFGASANRRSPLHKADSSISYLVGLTHILYESRKSAISEENASGVIDELRSRSLLP
jgi:hypothetical protein